MKDSISMRSMMSRTLLSLALVSAMATMAPLSWARDAGNAATKAAADATSAAAAAQTPAAKVEFVQVPGVYRQQIGQLQVTALLDGFLWPAAEVVQGISPKAVQTMLGEMYVPQDADGSQIAVNVFLVRREDRLMLVDAGAGNCMTTKVGKVMDSLRHAGVEPDAITDVLMTHAHPDHVCGLLSTDGQPNFPKARVWLAKAEADFWLSESAKAQAPEDAQPYFDQAMKSLKPYQDAGKLKIFEGNEALPSGVSVLQTPGHTPGHVSWLFDGGDAQFMAWGDIVHVHAIQFRDPTAWVVYDSDSKQAVKTRQQMLKQVAGSDTWVAGAHLPFPGIGHVARDGKAYRWIPTEFRATPTQR